MRKHLYIVLGSFFVLLGIIGVFFPIWPTTPFLLIAAFFYAHSSSKLYNWLINAPWLGEYIQNYREGTGVSMRKKLWTLIILWIAFFYTAFSFIPVWWGQVLLIVIGVILTVHIFTLKSPK